MFGFFKKENKTIAQVHEMETGGPIENNSKRVTSLRVLCRGEWRETTIETFVMPFWKDKWLAMDSAALLQICSRFKVEHLIFSDDVFEYVYLRVFESYYLNALPFLPHLKSITLNRRGIPPALKDILSYSRVGKLTWNFPNLETPLFRSDTLGVFDTFNLNMNTLPEWNYSVRELCFNGVCRHDEHMSYIHSPSDPCEDDVEWRHAFLDITKDMIDPWLGRNQLAFEKCQRTIIALIVLTKFKKINLDRNILRIIVMMIWETRCTQIWTDEPIVE